jgi:hypothetical protein
MIYEETINVEKEKLMKRVFKLHIIIIIALSFFVLLTGCENVKLTINSRPKALKEILYENADAKMQYDSNKWEGLETSTGIKLRIKYEKKGALIGVRRVASKSELKEYVYSEKKYIEVISVDGKVKEEEFNKLPILTYMLEKGEFDTIVTMIIIKDGEGFYELTFECEKSIYQKCINDALIVMSTFQIINSSK